MPGDTSQLPHRVDNLFTPYEMGVGALLQIASARLSCRSVDPSVRESWRLLSPAKLEGLLRTGTVPYYHRSDLAFCIAAKLATTARTQPAVDTFWTAGQHLLQGFALDARNRDHKPALQRGLVAATTRLAENVAQPQWLKRLVAEVKNVGGQASPQDWRTACGLTEQEFVAACEMLPRAVSIPPEEQAFMARVVQEQQSINAAASIASTPAIAASTSIEIRYDESDARLRVRGVRLSSFRGAPAALDLDFTRTGNPTSAIVFGDNGSGKSSIVDAIEFGLQGRIGRCSTLEGAFSPMARSPAAERLPHVEVDTTDGTVSRSAVTNGAGGILIDTTDVRPGFRLAPITLKRKDITHLFDTEALSRGLLILDYLPTDPTRMAIRPDDQLAAVEVERFELRTERNRLAVELGQILDRPRDGLMNRETLHEELRAHLGLPASQRTRMGSRPNCRSPCNT